MKIIIWYQYCIVKTFIRVYYAQIATKWFEYFVLNKSVKVETVRKLENLTVDTQKLIDNMQDLNKHFYPVSKTKVKNVKSKKE